LGGHRRGEFETGKYKATMTIELADIAQYSNGRQRRSRSIRLQIVFGAIDRHIGDPPFGSPSFDILLSQPRR
jgi:hypothetical protein